MAEEKSLTERALEKVRRLAHGNGLAPETITLVGTEEKTFVLVGKTHLTPKFDVKVSQHPGEPVGKGWQRYATLDEMRSEIGKTKHEFEDGMEWLGDAIDELRSHRGLGWGLEKIVVTLPKTEKKVASVTACPACGGQGGAVCQTCYGKQFVQCVQCQGRGRELCLHCYGKGLDPHDEKKPCYMCQGTGQMFCRICMGKMQVVCPECHARGRHQCEVCRGAGKIAEELTALGTVEGAFRLVPNVELPSGLLRGLDRLGSANLINGHAVIELFSPVDDDADKKSKTSVIYKASLPYADIRIKFGEAPVAEVGSFGLKGALLDCPAFLDGPLTPALRALHHAAIKGGSLSDAQKARAVREAIELEISGEGGDTPNGVKNLRKYYPVGLSQVAMRGMLRDAAAAVKKQTFHYRILAAVALFLVGCGLDAAYFFSPLSLYLAFAYSPEFLARLSYVPLFLSMIFGWFGTGLAAQTVLQRMFPGRKVAMPTIGKSGQFLLVALVLAFVAMACFAPIKPMWLQQIVG